MWMGDAAITTAAGMLLPDCFLLDIEESCQEDSGLEVLLAKIDADAGQLVMCTASGLISLLLNVRSDT